MLSMKSTFHFIFYRYLLNNEKNKAHSFKDRLLFTGAAFIKISFNHITVEIRFRNSFIRTSLSMGSACLFLKLNQTTTNRFSDMKIPAQLHKNMCLCVLFPKSFRGDLVYRIRPHCYFEHSVVSTSLRNISCGDHLVRMRSARFIQKRSLSCL